MNKFNKLNFDKYYTRATKNQRLIAAGVFVAILLIFLVFHLSGRGYFDLGQMFGPCGFKQKYSLPCPTCGMTRSFLAFAGGDIVKSFIVQPAGGFFCVILVLTAFLSLIICVFGVYFNFINQLLLEVKIRYIILFFGIVIACGWAVTLARAIVQRSSW